MLAPGIMISACGLLLLGTNNKYSLVVSRIRILDEEKRKLKFSETSTTLSPAELDRGRNIEEQLQLFYRRIHFVRNAVLAYTVAVALFILTSVLIGLDFALETDLNQVALGGFLLGMLSVLTGSMYMAREIVWGYRIVGIEVKSV
ncbi:MAG: DUF2721 domain-containing protein [Bacteroidetes bacterium HGW-Bacteroidetes-6]|nr:MAG: DUF2721 domain-containing protein [Bacteroidetes bacterium HGW-Bacteroidetes-6]